MDEQSPRRKRSIQAIRDAVGDRRDVLVESGLSDGWCVQGDDEVGMPSRLGLIVVIAI